MIETRINYIDRKDDLIVVVSAQFEDVTRTSEIVDGETVETATAVLIAEREYNFNWDLTDEQIMNYLEQERILFL
jgi:hypothetical protein